MSGSTTGEERAINILRELHAAEEELVGKAVVMTKPRFRRGKALRIAPVLAAARAGPLTWRFRLCWMRR